MFAYYVKIRRKSVSIIFNNVKLSSVKNPSTVGFGKSQLDFNAMPRSKTA